MRVINVFSSTHRHTIEIPDDLVVPETQHAIAFTLKVPGSCCVRRLLFHVLATIQLNHQAPFRTAEINDVTGYRVLSTELHALQLPAPHS
mgnify:FL=1